MVSSMEVSLLCRIEGLALDGTLGLVTPFEVRSVPLTRDFVGIFFMYPNALDESAQASTTASSSGSVIYVMAKNPSFLVSSSDVAIRRASTTVESRLATW